MLSDFPVCVIGDTFYVCRAKSFQGYYTIECPNNTLINVQSAIIGATGSSGAYKTPSDSNPNGMCPWTAFTNATCASLSIRCSNCECTCVRALKVPSNCTGQNRECNFERDALNFAIESPFCVLSEDAEFLLVNYTCNSGK
jgi:hypothetical protein